tara:strand:+ start:8007 stop:8261 length:255 start_codon:yes stop_codon:yes gene_type:complete
MEHKENTGVLFRNKYKEKESQPDYKGTALIDGKLKEVALWINTSKNNVQYFKAQFQDSTKEVEQGGIQKDQEIKKEQKDDGLPF